MKILTVTVFGASGKVGRLVVENLLARGYEVKAFVYSSSPFELSDKLQVVRGDIHKSNDVSSVLDGSDAVISCLGSWGTKHKDVLASAMKNIIPAMEKHNIKRIISLTGSAASLPNERLRLIDKLNRFLLNVVGHKILLDGESHLLQLAESNLDWTVIRSPVMKSRPKTNYCLQQIAPSPFATISRTAVAKSIVEQLDSTDFIKSAPHINNPTRNTLFN